MDEREIGVHKRHCCILHGCKYGEDDCPVVNEEVRQDHVCESCGWDGIKNVDGIYKYIEFVNKLDSLQKSLTKAKEQGVSDVNVNVDIVLWLIEQRNQGYGL